MTIAEDANGRVQRAQAQLDTATDRLNGYMAGTYQLLTGITLEKLEAEVASCNTNLEKANDTIQAALRGGRGLSPYAKRELASPIISKFLSTACCNNRLSAYCLNIFGVPINASIDVRLHHQYR